MKKTLLFFQSLLLVCLFSIVGASSAWAEEVTLTLNTTEGLKAGGFTAPAAGENDTVPTLKVSPITIALSNTKVYNSSGKLTFRVYKSSTIEFSTSEDYVITGVVFNGVSTSYSATNLTASVGKIEETAPNATWTGSTNSITFTASAQVRLNSIVVTYKEVTTETTEKTTTTLSYTGTQTLKQTKTLAAPMVTVADKSGTAIEGASVTWASSNTSVATVNATTGEVKGIGLGTATITASYAGNDTYGKSSASYDVEVIENVAETTTMALSYASTDTATVKQDATLPAPTVTVTAKSGTVVENPTITWTSANTSIATVDASTGVVTGTGVGITTITATFAANDTYGTSSASYKALVLDKDGYHTLIFPGTGKVGAEGKVNGYTDTCIVKMGTGDVAFVYEIAAFNNNQNTWSYIKAGRKSNASTPYIANTTPFEKYIESIAITVDKYTETTGDKFYFIVSDDADFKTVKETQDVTMEAGTVTLKPTYPGKYIKIYGEMKANGTKDNGNLEISKVVYTEAKSSVMQPVIAAESKNFNASFTTQITCSTEGASIYYTLNGDEPTSESTLYTSDGVTIPAATTTLKAIAIKDGTSSSVASATYTYITETIYETIAELKAVAEAKGTYYLNFNNVTVTGQDGNNAYMEDATAGILFYSTTDAGKYPAKDVLNGIAKVTYDVFNGKSEFTAIEGTLEKSTAAEVPCAEVYVEDLLTDMSKYESRRVRLFGYVSTEFEDKGTEATFTDDGENEIILFKSKSLTFDAATKYAYIFVEGYPVVFNNGSTTKNEIQLYSGYITADTKDVTVSQYGYSTLYCNDAFIVPEGLKAYTVTANGDNLKANEYAAGTTVPSKTGVVLEGTASKTYTYQLSADPTAAPTDNLLHGSTSAAETNAGEGSYKYYMLSVSGDAVGFYYGKENGAAFTNAAGKAYLAIPSSMAVAQFEGFSFDEFGGNITAISSAISDSAASSAAYDLNGRRINLSVAQKGIYVVNGKKVLVK